MAPLQMCPDCGTITRLHSANCVVTKLMAASSEHVHTLMTHIIDYVDALKEYKEFNSKLTASSLLGRHGNGIKYDAATQMRLMQKVEMKQNRLIEIANAYRTKSTTKGS